MLEITGVTSVRVVIMLLGLCISFFNLMTHSSLSEVLCFTWVSPQCLISHIQKLGFLSGLSLHGRCLFSNFLTNKKDVAL